ncbi:hypothetical protein TanjilG_32328 [Lupinus angustifolius]|uniref:Protein LNK3 n=1 Tax=Lupinus angustifolius TaxID=3871 RepID=A0A4P1R0Z9_LUPAN|nr:hypothetical protein TanjilG_32328 [Lupinus angustifolius]
MDCYYGCDINDFRVPEDQDLLDRHPSPENWSEWGINAPEGYESPKKYFTADTNSTELEFDFMDEAFSHEIELKASVHDKDQSTSSSARGGLLEQSFQQTEISSESDQPNYKLQDLSCFEQTDDIFLDSVIDDLSCVEDQHKSFYFSSENTCSNTPRTSQEDVEASKLVPYYSNSNDYLDIECNRDETMHAHSSLEESILQNLEMAIAQFTGKTRICFRDALYRLARDTKEQHLVENLDGGLNMQESMPHEVLNDTMRSEDREPMETDTNNVDRAVANLMYNKMETNMQDLPLTNIQEVNGT